MNLNNTVYYSVDNVADMVGRSKDWLWAGCRNRKLPHHRQGRRYVFTAADIAVITAMTEPVPVPVQA